jgi:polar amino acid transport system substrate-binding protein
MEGFATVQAAAAKDPSLGVLNVEPISPALISMGVKQGDQVWVNYLNNFIRNLNSSGDNQALYKKWFKADLPKVIAYQ